MMETKEKKKFDFKNLGIRIFGAACFLIILVPAFFLGGWFWFGAIALVSFLGEWEFYRVFGIEKQLSGIFGFICTAIYLTVLALGKTELLMPVILLSFILSGCAYVFEFTKMDAEKAMAGFFGFVYLTVMPSCLIRMRAMEGGLYLVLLTAISSWICDTCAYLFGMALGRHKMSPHLSPNKSVEGGVGGVLGAVLIAALFGFLFKDKLPMNTHPVLACCLVTLMASLLSMVGDLLASAFKRHKNIKDYSHLIPGHGGILDRFDSFIFIAPVIYYLAQVFMK